MSLDNLAIEYRIELPTAEEFERLFRSSGWTEALGVTADRLAATLPHAWYAVCARRGDQPLHDLRPDAVVAHLRHHDHIHDQGV